MQKHFLSWFGWWQCHFCWDLGQILPHCLPTPWHPMQHQWLLEVDFGILGSGTTEQRLVWLEEIEKALCAKQAVAGVSEQEWIDWSSGDKLEEAKQRSVRRWWRRRCNTPHGYDQAQTLGWFPPEGVVWECCQYGIRTFKLPPWLLNSCCASSWQRKAQPMLVWLYS